MEWWREDLLGSLLERESEHQLFDRAAGMAAAIGFEYCAYGIQIPVPISRPSVTMFSNYSRQWQSCYHERNYLHVDPTVRHALQSTLPVVWSNNLFASAQEMWEDAREHGLKFGWAQSSRDARGSVGLLTLARSTEQLSECELHANQPRMVWLTQCIHAAMSKRLTPRLAPETQVGITAREKEVLRWTAEGKTASEIAQILVVSERTINFHINNVVTKLGASNKTQAAVKATALGLLY